MAEAGDAGFQVVAGLQFVAVFSGSCPKSGPNNNPPWATPSVGISMQKIIQAFAIASFSWLGGMDATAAPVFWQGPWEHPPTAINDLPPVTRPDRGASRPVYAPCRLTGTRLSAKWCASAVRRACIVYCPSSGAIWF
jgi:hypothetical protein